MSSLFTAAVFWAMTMWYDHADEPRSSKWIVLIAFLMGLSIGVHLLNLLAIPALVFMFYYKKNEAKRYKKGKLFLIFLLGVVILGAIFLIYVPYLPKLAAYFDLIAVNWFGLPYNSGAAFFLVALLVACFWGIYKTMEKGKVLANSVLLCFTVITIGFSIFSIDIIRSCAKTPTNEYQPDNAFTLVRYLSREQYGSTPLIYGHYFDAPYDLETPKYWAPLDGKYKKVDGPAQPKYRSSGNMLFPRMWSDSSPSHIEIYKSYTKGKGTKVPGSTERKPTMGANLRFFFDYQMHWMYWRYFMWNFVGRQNDIHAPSANLFHGNWESGIGFLDQIRLGDQSDAPDVLKENKGKNHYYFLPLLLGLLGLFFQFDKDKRGSWLNFLMFFMTGIAIVLYLNQPPLQVRERDYAYAGSFYFFSVWIGLGVVAIAYWIQKAMKKQSVTVSLLTSVLALGVPAIMAAQNWDDHDRSNRYTAPELAYNYLSSVGQDGILITHGDNDTFPLWYAQEVEGVRTDVRVVNTSLLGTDWHIDQMKWACNESAPLDLTVPHRMYLYGTNEYVPIADDTEGQVIPIKRVMEEFKDSRKKVRLTSGRTHDYIMSHNISVPVNVDNAIKAGIVDEKYRDMVPTSITLTIPQDKSYITKPELFLLDLLSNYEWDRPLHVLGLGGDLNVGIKDYLEFQGFSWRLVPFKSKNTVSSSGFVDADNLYSLIKDSYKFDALAREDYFVDYQNLYTFLGVISVRSILLNASDVFTREGQYDRAKEMLDIAMEATKAFPYETVPIGLVSNDLNIISMVDGYFRMGDKEKAKVMAERLSSELLQSVSFYLQFYEYAKDDLDTVSNFVVYLAQVCEEHGEAAMAKSMQESLYKLFESYN